MNEEFVSRSENAIIAFLKSNFNAQGDTFFKLINNVEHQLDDTLVSNLHRIRKLRNELFHHKFEADLVREHSLLIDSAWERLLRVAVPCGSNTTFLIINKNSGKALDVPWEQHQDTVHQWDCHGHENQRWLLRRTQEGSVLLVSRYTGRCLDVEGHSHVPGTFVHQWKFHGGENQLWLFEEQEDHSYCIRAKHSGLCLDVDWGSADNGAAITQWPFHGADNQRWWLKAIL